MYPQDDQEKSNTKANRKCTVKTTGYRYQLSKKVKEGRTSSQWTASPRTQILNLGRGTCGRRMTPLKRLSFWGSYCLRPICNSMVSLNFRPLSFDSESAVAMHSRNTSPWSLLLTKKSFITCTRHALVRGMTTKDYGEIILWKNNYDKHVRTIPKPLYFYF